MPTYDSLWFSPPAPLARVRLTHPETKATVSDVPMLIDSGADVTLLPIAAVASLGIEPLADKRYELVNFDKQTSFASVVRLELHFLGRTFRGQFLLAEQEWGVIGRNVLNAVPILLDGPRLAWEEAS